MVIWPIRGRAAGTAPLILATAAAAATLALPGLARAQGGPANPFTPGAPPNPLSPLTPTAPPVTTAPAPPVAPTTSTSGGGLTGTDAVLIAVGALVVLGGISLFIWYDARRRAPVRQRAAAAAGGPGGSRPRPKGRKLSPAERRRRKRGRAR